MQTRFRSCNRVEPDTLGERRRACLNYRVTLKPEFRAIASSIPSATQLNQTLEIRAGDPAVSIGTNRQFQQRDCRFCSTSGSKCPKFPVSGGHHVWIGGKMHHAGLPHSLPDIA
jgi:hypothetical protein